ncbi:MAG: hypothetical protein ACREFE_12870 [Limisphaerales bacterium]
MPKNFWIYKRLPPHPFSTTVISNAVVLASLQSKGFPKPSTNDFYLVADHPANYPGTIPEIFSITPKTGTILYGLPHPGTNTSDIPADKILVQRAWTCAAQLGVDATRIAFKEMTSHFNQDENGNDITNQPCSRGVFLSRLLDEISFTDIGDDGANGGFWIEFGSHGQVRGFSLVWPDLKRSELQPTASPQQIIACIRAFKTMSPPIGQETHYFTRLKTLAQAKKLTITKITPAYMEGIYGDMTESSDPSKFIAPFAELEAIADFGNSNMPVRLLSPILSSEVGRLLTEKSRSH